MPCILTNVSADNAPTRKPGTGMLCMQYFNDEYDIEFLCHRRPYYRCTTGKNLGCKAIWLNNEAGLVRKQRSKDKMAELQQVIALETSDWSAIYEYLQDCAMRHTNVPTKHRSKIED